MSIKRLLIAAAVFALVAGGVAAQQTVFRLYTALTGNEVIGDMANATGGQFTSTVLAQFVTRGFPHASLTTVAALPSCASASKGQTYYVTDASSPTYGGTLTGSSTTFAIAICDGTNWTSH